MKRLIFAGAIALFSTQAFAELLKPGEKSKIAHYKNKAGHVLISYEQFVAHSERPAKVVYYGELFDEPFLFVERDGEYATLVYAYVLADLMGLGKAQLPPAKGSAYIEYCDSSCLDDAWAKGMWGALDGAQKGFVSGAGVGGAIGWYWFGPPGGALGAGIGGGVGVVVGGGMGTVAGGIEGYNSCQKGKAETCGQ